MKYTFILILIITAPAVYSKTNSVDINALKHSIEKKYEKKKPVVFSQYQKGIKNKIISEEKLIALTFDACGRTPEGSKLNKALIDFLVSKKIPATLFISGLWLDKNKSSVTELSRNRLFEIENHGLKHKPASVKGQHGYGIKGTKNISEFVDEIELNARKIEDITGRRPIFYRPGTAFFDDIAVMITYDLNHTPLNFSINPGDADQNLKPEYLASYILKSARNGSIVIMHMNHPENNTLKTLEIAVPVLIKKGYRFVKLEDYRDKLNK
jgi:peptidoglycan/xylan/chitin deacetylase (PgdA/CDA1 family)